MKTYMPLNGLRWSRNSGSANCDMPQSAVFGRPGGVNFVQANAASVSIPQEKGSYISMSEAYNSGALTLTSCSIDSNGGGYVIGSTGISSVIELRMSNATAGNYILSFRSGAQNITATVNVEVTSGGYKVSKDFNIANTGSWTPVDLHSMELNNLPAGEVTMKLTVKEPSSGFAGNYGYFCVAKKSYFDPISSIDLTKGYYVTARHENNGANVGNCQNGSIAAYTAYNSVAGYATLNMGLIHYNPGTITVTVTDALTEAVELTKVLDITSDNCHGYNTPTHFPLGNLTQGLKNIKFTMAVTKKYLCNYANLGISVVPQFDVEVGPTGFATIGFPYATTLPEGVKGYAVTNVTATNVTLAEVPTGTNIAAKTGLIIVAKPGSYTFPVVESGEEIAGNQLLANTEGVKTATTEGEFYVLAVTNKTSKTVGLAQIAQGGTLAKNRAYMPATAIPPASGSAQPASFRLVFGDATMVTEVGESDAEAVETVVYNLAGQRVNANAKGLVVVKGRVYLKK